MAVPIVFLAAGCRPQRDWDDLMAELPPEKRRQLEPMQSVPMVSQGVEDPQLIAGDEATLRGTQEVIGIVVQGIPRAYSLRALSGTQQRVVNDHVIDEHGDPRAFTITYCNSTECIRVFEPVSGNSAESLKMGTVGLIDGGLVLSFGDHQFKQADNFEGLRDVPHQRMTWDEWKAEHPDTFVYTGERDRILASGAPILTP